MVGSSLFLIWTIRLKNFPNCINDKTENSFQLVLGKYSSVLSGSQPNSFMPRLLIHFKLQHASPRNAPLGALQPSPFLSFHV
jgi:hypothetical protein